MHQRTLLRCTVSVRALTSATYLALSLVAGLPMLVATPVSAQGISDLQAPDGQLVLRADSLIYDFDAENVTAVGGVQIQYGGYRMVARKVAYDQKTGHLHAYGDVELIDPTGTRAYADELDVTDTFGEGFIQALRVETTDNTRFAAASATRDNEDTTTFERGVYTA